MRRLINGFVLLLALPFVLVGLTLSGCNGDSTGDSVIEPPPAATGMLRPVQSADELETTLKRALAGVTETSMPEGGVAAPGASGGFSGTYTVEAGVDELDFVRYDGSHLYIAHSAPGNAAIRILRTDPASATATQVGSIPFDSAHALMGMYVSDGRLFLVTSEVYYGPYGGGGGGIWPAIVIWAPSKFTVQVHDVRDPAHPRQLMSATIDGVFVESRRIDDRVVIVSRHTSSALIDPARRPRIASLDLRELVAEISIDGRTSLLVDPRRCFVSTDPAARGHAVLTSINTFSLSDPRDIDGICYDEPTNGVYASRDALYVSEPRFGTGISSSTRIHKFSLRGARPDYVGSVEIPGMVWTGGQQDFRMNESGGLLRVLTSDSTGDSADFVDHRLFVLREKAGERALEIIGRLPNDARPEEIGKPNESLYGVRFAGDRVYAVTFQRIDPLYVIDLSTPADPRIAGQLLVPGVSDFLHPVTRDLLLGLGSDGSRVKLELFDTSVLEQPQSRGVITLGTITSNTIALYDRHAFAYLPGEATDRFAIPTYIYHQQPGAESRWTLSLHQFEIAGKQSAPGAYLSAAGEVSPPHQDAYAGPSHRSFINGDTVYYLYNGQIWGSFWSTPSQINGPF